jgi:hypothetical protein
MNSLQTAFKPFFGTSFKKIEKKDISGKQYLQGEND